MKNLLLIIVFTFIVPNICSSSESNIVKSFLREAKKNGHCNISITERGDTLLVTYWPLGFRDDYEAFKDMRHRVLCFIEKKNDSQIKNIELTQTSWGLSVLQAHFEKESPSSGDKFSKVFKSFSKEKIKNIYSKSHRFLVQFICPV